MKNSTARLRNFRNIIVRLQEEEKAVINLKGVTITSSTTDPIYIESGDKVEISAKSDTINVINDNLKLKKIIITIIAIIKIKNADNPSSDKTTLTNVLPNSNIKSWLLFWLIKQPNEPHTASKDAIELKNIR